jgi:hypothetical protein
MNWIAGPLAYAPGRTSRDREGGRKSPPAPTSRVVGGYFAVRSIAAARASHGAARALENENKALREEVRGLRDEVSALKTPVAAAPLQKLEERLDIQEKRVEEQAQTKVEAAQRFPIRLSGMVLVNAFHNGSGSGGADTPTTVARVPGRQTGGISLRQSIVGLEFTGSNTFIGAKARGSVFMDFYEGNTETTNFYPVRFRTGGFHLDWATHFVFRAGETVVSRRDRIRSPTWACLLTSAGNLWAGGRRCGLSSVWVRAWFRRRRKSPSCKPVKSRDSISPPTD